MLQLSCFCFLRVSIVSGCDNVIVAKVFTTIQRGVDKRKRGQKTPRRLPADDVRIKTNVSWGQLITLRALESVARF